MKKVLVIFEEIPEYTHFYILEEEGQDLEDTLAAHGQVINISDDTDAANKLAVKIENETPIKIKDGPLDVKKFDIDFVVWFGWYI